MMREVRNTQEVGPRSGQGGVALPPPFCGGIIAKDTHTRNTQAKQLFIGREEVSLTPCQLAFDF